LIRRASRHSFCAARSHPWREGPPNEPLRGTDLARFLDALLDMKLELLEFPFDTISLE
jgi:hypothetical protein